jgi:hypothetical protein
VSSTGDPYPGLPGQIAAITGNSALLGATLTHSHLTLNKYNDAFDKEKARVVNRFTKEFIGRFCDDTGAIDWVKLVGFNSGNYDLDTFLS